MMNFAGIVGAHEEVMLIPKGNVRRVVGPKGVKIQMIRETSGARIDIDNDVLPGSDSQLCKIKGTLEQCAMALGLINSALSGEIPAIPSQAGPLAIQNATGFPAPSNRGPRPDETELLFAPEVVTAVIGQGGSQIKAIRAQTGARINIDPHERRGGQQPIRFSGTDAQVQAAIEMVKSVVAQDPKAAAVGANPPNYTTIECPASKVRSVVGAKGATIQQIRQQTGARIDIDNDCVPGSLPPVQLVRFAGDAAAVQLAIQLVQERIESMPKFGAAGKRPFEGFGMEMNKFAKYQ